MPLSAFPMSLLHGSPNSEIERLAVAYCYENNPFGPAIYLTADPIIASYYAKLDGVIYEVHLQGDLRYIICLDQSWENQTPEAASAIAKLLLFVGQYRESDTSLNARTVIEMTDSMLGKCRRNQMLHSFGIWLLYGHLDRYEVSGRRDFGIQFAVLHERAIAHQSKYVHNPNA